MITEKLKKIYAGAWMLLLVLFASCANEWDSHYDAASSVSRQSLWEVINSRPELSTFASILKKTGYDNTLSSSQTYTVFAPVNDALSGINLEDVPALKKMVANQIARFSNTASGTIDNRLSMINGKFTKFEVASGQSKFGGVKVQTANIPAANGILHTVEGVVPFYQNIWEYIGQTPGLDSLKRYLYSFDDYVFNRSLSTPIDINSDGETVYDSVFVNSNVMFNVLGNLNREADTYTAILPTNAAWREAYGRIKQFFRYNIGSDSLQRKYTNYAIVKNLVFNTSLPNPSSLDSLQSTSGTVFYKPGHLFDGANQVALSNGVGYTTDLLKFKALESWHNAIVVEAEDFTGRVITTSSTTGFTRTIYQSSVGKISGNKYLELTPNTTSSRPSVSFEIPNTLSATYNIYCVFVPGNVLDANNVNEKTKVSFSLTYINENGRTTTVSYTPANNATSPTEMTKMLVTSNFKFPFANYAEKNTTVSLKVSNIVANNETTTYNRNMRIDCIILEPVDIQP